MGAESASRRDVVYIVDDDAGVRAALRMLVRSLGIEAQAFASGRAFFDAFDRQRGACLLLDVRMPGMSGLEVKRKLSAMDADIHVIFLTAQGGEEIPGSMGTVERVQKPFRDDYLVRRLRELVRCAPQRGEASPNARRVSDARMAKASRE